MARVKSVTATRKRRKKILKRAKGFWGGKKNLFKKAAESVDRAGQYAYRDRKTKKRNFRNLWIVRINAAARSHGMTYSRFMQGMNKAKINMNRKTLSQLAVSDEKSFQKLVDIVKKQKTSNKKNNI